MKKSENNAKVRSLSVILALTMLVLLLASCAKQQDEAYSIDNIRNYVVGLDSKVTLENGRNVEAINFDNAATTPALQPVMDEVDAQLQQYGSIGRGKGQKSAHSTEIYENGRMSVLSFFNAPESAYSVFYSNSTTDGLNKLASALITSTEDIVLTSRMEHHANDLPWRHRGETIYAEVDALGRLNLNDMERLLIENQGKVKFVSVTAASNVTGYVNDVHAIAKLAHKYGAKIIVDGAQITAHRAFSMTGDTSDENIDFFAFSAHKMYSPYGGGAVIGLKTELDSHMPQFYGGGIVDTVADYEETYLSAPALYEAGSPNYPGVVGMLNTMEILKEVGFDAIQSHEQVLMRKMLDGLTAIEGVVLYGDSDKIDDRVGVITFNITGLLHSDVAAMLADQYGIAVRQGAFCSHPYVFRLLGIPDSEITSEMYSDDFSLPGMVRISFGIYNTEQEVDSFLDAVSKIAGDSGGSTM